MGKNSLFIVLCLFSSSLAQQAPPYKVCIAASSSVCQALDKGDSQVVCESIETKVDCALKLESGQADLGVFSEEELLLLGIQHPNSHRVVASIRDSFRQDPYAFEAVAVVSSSHSAGLEGLKNGKYCHPGLDVEDIRWSPRVLKAFEQAVAQTNACTSSEAKGKTPEEIEVHKLSHFFSAACRPGEWSKNATIDVRLKSSNPKLCSLCGGQNNCNSYLIDMGTPTAGFNANNRHIQALECLKQNNNNTVSYVAWQHVKEYFSARSTVATAYALLCPDGSVRPLTNELLLATSAPCAFIRQPYPALVASTTAAATLQARLREWWPQGTAPTGNTWQTVLFNAIVGGANARVEFVELTTPANYTSHARNLSSIDSVSSCTPAQRWCTISAQENNKCSWLRAASHVLGLPDILCQQRTNVFECLRDVRDDRADLIVTSSNYGYIARQHYRLTPVKMVQNSQSSTSSFSRVAALVKETTAQSDITRFENLRNKNACFPEFGGIAFVAFVRAAHERGVISSSECDYAKSVEEFFGEACAPGALDAEHAMSDHTSVNSTALCALCRPPTSGVTVAGNNNVTCGWDSSSNLYFGNQGAMACLTDPNAHVAFVDIKNINAHLQALNLNANQFRALCRNNQLAPTTGVNITNDCLLAYVVDAEILTRRNDPHYNTLNALLDTVDAYFGYTTPGAIPLIDFKIFSPFNGQPDLLFGDSANGLTEPTNFAENIPARNYIELFAHLQTCTGSAPGLAAKSVYSILSLVIMTLLATVVA